MGVGVSKAKRVAQANRRARFVLGDRYVAWRLERHDRAVARMLAGAVNHNLPPVPEAQQEEWRDLLERAAEQLRGEAA